jgi:hypothetical protein
MKRKITLLIMLVMVFSLCFGAVGAFAAGEDVSGVRNIMIAPGDKKYMQEDVWAHMGDDGEYLKLEFKENTRNDNTDTRLLVYDNDGGVIKFNLENFRTATEKSKLNALKIFVTELQDSRVANQTQQNVIDAMVAMNKDVSTMLLPMVMDATSADLYTAMKFLNPILPILRVLFGIGAIFISLFLIGVTIIDMCFIGLPIAREQLQTRADEKGGGKIPFVSSDAISVVRDVESSLQSSGSYKNAYLLYFKRRVLTYIILSICLLYLVLGELGGLISWLLNLGSGVV